jgi:hypothetical protein
MLIPDRTGVAAVARNDATRGLLGERVEVWALVAITLLAAVLRFSSIASQSYWFDEAATVHLMHLGFGAMLNGVAKQESTPPLYYVLAWPWARLFGTGEAGLRSLSALAGIAAIPITYLCGRELVSGRAGLVAAALAAVNPFLIWYSQEARSYMLLVALSGASFLFFARAWREPSRRNLSWWGVMSALALLTHFFAGFLVAPEAIALLWRGRDRFVLAAAAAVAAVQLALLPLVVSDASHPLQGWITSFPLRVRIEQVPVAFGIGTLYQSATAISYGPYATAALAGCVIVLLLIGADGEELRGAGIAAGVAAFTLLAPLLLVPFGHDYYLARNVLPAWIPLAVVVGAACTARRAQAAGATLAVVLLAAFVWAGIRIDGNPEYQRPDWRGVAAALGRPHGPRAIVAYDGTIATVPLALYLPGASARTAAQGPAAVSELDVVGGTWQTVPASAPSGLRLIAAKAVDGHLVARYAAAPAWRLSSQALAARAAPLLAPARPGGAVLLQRGS